MNAPTDCVPTQPLQSTGGDVALDHSPPASDAAAHLAPPGYEILGELGRGGMGVVYHARQIALNLANFANEGLPKSTAAYPF